MISLGKMSTLAKYVSAVGIIAAVLLTIALPPKEQGADDGRTTATPDYSNHPIYSAYDFSNSDSVINIGLQPLYLPASWIFEVVKRDTILKNELSTLGLEARYYPFLKGDDVNFFLRRGDLDAGIGGDMPALTIAATHQVIIPAMTQQGFTSIVAKRPMLIENLRDKRIGFAFGSNAHFTVLDALASEGLTEHDVDLVAMEVTEMPEALNLGHIEAFSSWEPIPIVTLATVPNSAVIHRGMSTGYLYFSRSFCSENYEAVCHIVAAEVRSIRWLRLRSENVLRACEWACQSGKVLSESTPEYPMIWEPSLARSDLLSKESSPFIPKSDLLSDGPLRREFEFLKEFGKIPDHSRWEAVRRSFDRRILIEVLSNPKKYSLSDPSLAMREN